MCYCKSSFQDSLILLPQSSVCTPRSCLPCSPLCVLQLETDSLFTFLSPVHASTLLSDITQLSPTEYTIRLYLYSVCYNKMICRCINLHSLPQWLDYAEYTVVNSITTIIKCDSLTCWTYHRAASCCSPEPSGLSGWDETWHHQEPIDPDRYRTSSTDPVLSKTEKNHVSILGFFFLKKREKNWRILTYKKEQLKMISK